MNLSDFLIIYLAFGAPFGVYYFLQNRKVLHRNKLWLNAFLTMTVWFPYAFQLLQKFITAKLNSYKLSKIKVAEAFKKTKIDQIEKEISQMLLVENSEIALFDFREAFQRYAGLTNALQNAGENMSSLESERELFRVAGNENVELGAKCLHRRNLNRLKFHQNLARRDILQIFGAINAVIKESEKFRLSASSFFKFLNDVEAENALGEIFGSSSQTINDFAVRNLEKDLWKPREDQPLHTNQTPLNLRVMSAATAATTRKRE
jgi:hypothetical protein